jgi:hypothetical protein
MKRSLQLCVGIVLLGELASGQEVQITSFNHNGVVAWTAPSGSVCTIEWASRLATSQEWTRSWNAVTGLRMTNSQASAAVPMFYRVMCNTNPPLMITPYVNEADMQWVRQGYSATTNCPWEFEHDGVDFEPVSNLAPFRAVCDGTISELCLRREPDIEGEGGKWGVYVMLQCDDTWTATYDFEPKSSNMADGMAQFTNITVALMQSVSRGDVIGYLHEGDESAHVHFAVRKSGYQYQDGAVVCPKPFFSAEARESIMRLVTNRFPQATDFCY